MEVCSVVVEGILLGQVSAKVNALLPGPAAMKANLRPKRLMLSSWLPFGMNMCAQ